MWRQGEAIVEVCKEENCGETTWGWRHATAPGRLRGSEDTARCNMMETRHGEIICGSALNKKKNNEEMFVKDKGKQEHKEGNLIGVGFGCCCKGVKSLEFSL